MNERDCEIELYIERITELKQQLAKREEENERLSALNRHYLFHFYDGDIDKMMQDFHYIK